MVGGPGPLVFYLSLLITVLLGMPLLAVYMVLAVARNDWTRPRRAVWAVAMWVLSPLAMPVYFVKHVRSSGQ